MKQFILKNIVLAAILVLTLISSIFLIFVIWNKSQMISQSMADIERLLDEYLPRDCILDLSHLKFMDSSGIALILKLHRRAQETGGRAWVENAAAQPMRVIDASGIERLVTVAAREEARA